MDAESCILSFKPRKTLIEDSKHYKEDFDFRDLDPVNEIYPKDATFGKIKW